jgi:hypothetical protein
VGHALGLFVGLAVTEAGCLGGKVASVALRNFRKIFRRFQIRALAFAIPQFPLYRLANRNAL